MLALGASAGALTRERALAVLEELAMMEHEAAHYRVLVEKIRSLVGPANRTARSDVRES